MHNFQFESSRVSGKASLPVPNAPSSLFENPADLLAPKIDLSLAVSASAGALGTPHQIFAIERFKAI